LLFRRSVVTAAIVYAVIDGLEVAKGRTAGEGLAFVLGIAAFVAGFAGPVFVQGALVEIVRNVHEGRVPKRIDTLYRDARAHFWSLLGASIMYGLGVFFGLILLIVPGLIAAARWCLFAPMIMLEGYTAEPARVKSSQLVKGRTGQVLVIVIACFVLVTIPPLAFKFAVGSGSIPEYATTFGWSSLTAPFAAHVLTVIYYRLADPDRPVIHEDIARSQSVWQT
jgi:hypothetical protein